jgi:hypothetical protein
MYSVRDLLLGTGLYWCVFCDRRMVRAFHGPDAEEKARHLANELNGGGR